MKKRIMSLGLAVLMLCSMMCTTAFAATPEKEVYTMTVDAEIVSTYLLNNESTQTASSSMGLALDPGQSGWSNVVNVRFSTLPSNAVVESIEIVPGTATINGGNSNMLGTVLPSRLTITSPNGTSASVAWANTMTTTAFRSSVARGTWTLQFYGTNLTQPTGDYMNDLLRVGSTSYKSVKVTITYELDG